MFRVIALVVVLLLVVWLHAPILTALGLVKEGWAPKILVDGPNGNYGLYECDLAIPFAVKAGYPESYFIHFENPAHSTQEEMRLVDQKMHSLGMKRAIV